MRIRPLVLLAAAATLALSGCVFTLGGDSGGRWLPQPPAATGQPTPTWSAPDPDPAPRADPAAVTPPGPLGVDRCSTELIDGYVAEMTGFPGIASDEAGAREADHPVALPLGGAAVHCATTLDFYDGLSVHTVVVLVGDAVPDQVRSAAGDDVIVDDLDSPHPWLGAEERDGTSGMDLFPAEPESIAALGMGADDPVWIMEAWWLRPY